MKRVLQGFFEVHGIEVSPDGLKMWLAGLRGLSPEQLITAVDRYNRECSQRPTPAGLRRYAGAAALSDEQRAEVAWRSVRSTMLRYGAYYAINFDDRIIHAAIRAVGGWSLLCQTQQEDLVWKEKDFKAQYVSICRSGIGDSRPLSGLLERQEPIEIETGMVPHEYSDKLIAGSVPVRKVALPDLSTGRALR